MWLMQGCFYQPHISLQPAMRDGEISVAVLARMGVFPFSGTIRLQTFGTLQGNMEDCFGRATLRNVRMRQDEFLSFTKKYDNRPDTIEYEFHYRNGIWVGDYTGDETGRGDAKCIVTEVPNDFYTTPPSGSIETAFTPPQGT